MKRLLGTIAVAAAVALGVSGCGYKAESGYVIEKEYKPAHDVVTQPHTSCTYNSTTKSQTCVYHAGYTTHYHECYKIRVEDEKEHRGSWCVSPETYASTDINDYFDAKPSRD